MTRPVAALLQEVQRFSDAARLIAPMLAEAGIADAQDEARALLRAFIRRPACPARPWRASCRHSTRTLPPCWQNGRSGASPASRSTGSKDRAALELELGVDRSTLSPRPDTETLVTLALDLAGSGSSRQQPRHLLDLGTGTARSCLPSREWPQATGMGIDCSAGAVERAKANARANAALIRMWSGARSSGRATGSRTSTAALI